MAGQWCILVALVVPLLSTTDGAQVLGIFPIPAKSHKIVFAALTRELARRGHEVTVISPYPEKQSIPNLTDIEVPMALEGNNSKNFFDKRGSSVMNSAATLWGSGYLYCSRVLQHPEVQKIIHSEHSHFDVIIVEAFMNECVFGFAHIFKAPVIQICAFGGFPWMADWVGNPYPYAYVPDPFLDYTDHMSFWERLVNTVSVVYWRIGQDLYNIPKQDAVMRQFFKDPDSIPPLSQLVHNTSLLLVNNHLSLSYPRPLMPNFIEVGGMHVQPPKKLSQDLQTYLDEAPHGAIYFSMGSILQGSLMPEYMKNSFLEAFSTLKQRVLWKWESDSLPGQPNNVKVGRWMPQSDILAHPNVRLFITHGGLLGKQEAITHGVPLLGIPIYGDQHFNMRKAKASGYGVHLGYNNITKESVSWAIQTALQHSYRENAQRLSRIYRDQPQTPLQKAVFWTEYVIRHKGAPHMRSAALDLTWYQYFLLDVIAVFTLAVGTVLLIVFLILRAVFRKMGGSPTRSLKSGSKYKNS